MSVYFIAQIKVEDEQIYQEYLKYCDEIFEKYTGKYLSVDSNPIILEGDWAYTKMVVIRFESEEELRAWYESQEYQKILAFRLQAAKCDTIIVKGL